MYMFGAASALYQLLAMKALAKEEAVESLSYNALQSCQTPHKSGPPERKQSYAKIDLMNHGSAVNTHQID